MELLPILVIFDLLEFTLGLPKLPDVFNDSLICGGADAMDKGIEYFFRYNTSSASYCFFELPHHPDLSPFAPGHDESNPRGEGTYRLVNMTAAREHCAKYSATLPLPVPDTDLFWPLHKAAGVIKHSSMGVVPLGITKMVMKSSDSAEITWDDGKTSMLVGDVFETNPDGTQKCCLWLQGVDEKRLTAVDFRVNWHMSGGLWVFGPSKPIPGLLVLCQQNLTEMLTSKTTSTTSAVSLSSRPASFSQDVTTADTVSTGTSSSSSGESESGVRQEYNVVALLLIVVGYLKRYTN